MGRATTSSTWPCTAGFGCASGARWNSAPKLSTYSLIRIGAFPDRTSISGRPFLEASWASATPALHFGGVAMHDPFIALSARGRKYAVVSALEFGRVKRHSDFGTVLPLEAWLEKARRAWPRRSPGPALVVALLARELKAGPFTVPDDFPAGLYRELCGLGLRIRISAGALFPEREIKSPSEAAAIREGNRCSATGIAAAERLLRACRVRAGRLLHKGSVL